MRTNTFLMFKLTKTVWQPKHVISGWETSSIALTVGLVAADKRDLFAPTMPWTS